MTQNPIGVTGPPNSASAPAAFFGYLQAPALSESPGAGGHDECRDASGRVREHWRYISQALAGLGMAELQQRYQEARRLMRDHGVAFGAVPLHEQGREHPWQLDPIPLPLASDEWRAIERGLTQRAELFRRLLADLYGPNEVMQRGLLPPELIYSHPGFLRPCASIQPPEDAHLPVYAVDLIRGPGGGFYAIDDRAQAPPGIGYALENRVVLSRVLPSLFRDAQVHRLAPYFRALRATLMRLAWYRDENTRIVLLTPGPSSETYFEQIYLANYLGYTLVEGGDLTVRGGQVWLKTLDGLQRVDVILRALNDLLCDPLELRSDSAAGVAGLLSAARGGGVTLANPLGAGVLENPALLGFLPALAHHLLGEELILPSPATFWCGIDQQRQHVLANMQRLLIRRTVNNGVGQPAVNGWRLDNSQRQALAEQIEAYPYAFIGQEPVAASTAPVLAGDRLEPRSVVLRSFLVATENDYLVMPGGLCRVAAGADMPVESVQSGGISKDTWVLASEAIQPISLLGPRSDPAHAQAQSSYAMHQGELPSRVAENLFWLGRYAERSECVVRLLRAVFLYLLEPDEDYSGTSNRACLDSLLRAVTHITETYPGFVDLDDGAAERLATPGTELLAVFSDQQRPGSLAATLNSLLYSANSIRDRLSPDLWRVFTDIGDARARLNPPDAGLSIDNDGDNEALNDALAELNQLLKAFAAITGLALDSMMHGQGWRFLMLGRRLERAQQTVRLLDATLVQVSDDESMLMEYLLRICDSLMTYRSRYRSQLQIHNTLELLLQDETNPRAVGYQLDRLHRDVVALPGVVKNFPYRRPEQALALDAASRLRLSKIQAFGLVESGRRPLLKQLLDELAQLLPQLSTAIGQTYFSHADRPRQLIDQAGDRSL